MHKDSHRLAKSNMFRFYEYLAKYDNKDKNVPAV